MSLYEIQVKTIDGRSTTLADYKGKMMLVVNVASKCGYTPQYDGLEKIYEQYKDKGLVVLGFPCNQFGAQEPDGEEKIASFCKMSFGVTFPMFAKVDVNGDDTHPLFAHLKKEAPGLLGTELIKWNFTKFLIDREGNVVKRYAPKEEPADIGKELAAKL